jgi:hypothetical protein
MTLNPFKDEALIEKASIFYSGVSIKLLWVQKSVCTEAVLNGDPNNIALGILCKI